MARDEAYRKAEEKIDEARQSEATELKLNGMGLSELPESLGELAQLQRLSLAGNRLASLPGRLGWLKGLHSLDLSNNVLVEVPESLGRLTQLQVLDLGSNELTALPEWLDHLACLQTLNVDNNKLTSLPVSLGQLWRLQSLDVCVNRLAALPNSLGRLTQLQQLNLSRNRLTALPGWITVLAQLWYLRVYGNQLTNLPESIGQLKSLRVFLLPNNHLTELPDSLGDLPNLQRLDLGHRLGGGGNPIGQIPKCIFRLQKLEDLAADHCDLTEVPAAIGELKSLRRLQLNFNRISSLPTSLAELECLTEVNLDQNPITPELAAACKEGINAVKRYLRELAKGARRRFEAKLLILGDGNEGKTCVSRTLRGLPFERQVTTRGVDVEQWVFAHPNHAADENKNITLNIWDFEGQEINHQTHQFFLTTQALYILVFKCRDQFLMHRAEYWLDTIRARAPKARVAIVITESEKRTPYVPQDKLQSLYGDLLAPGKWLFPVGCEDNSGVPELRAHLKRWAAELEFMGREWPESYSKAETAIKDKAKAGMAHITRGQLYELFKACAIDASIFTDLAGAMATLGVITEFADCPDLRGFIVLQPQWLTKAISEVMEDRQLAADRGEISLQRMQSIWEGKAYTGLFSTFHNCMKEFELCYDLEDGSRSCLVPLRFGYEKPEIPWSGGEDVKQRRVEYKLNIRPPMGLMSRFIVKTHHMMVATAAHPKGVYWHNGVFLRTGSGPLASEALCEFDNEERKMRVVVRAAFPQNMIEQIHAYVKAVFSFFSGMEAERSYGCIKIDGGTNAEVKCKGLHSESRIYSAIRKQRVLDCEYEFHDVDPQKLIWGFTSFGEYVMAKVASVEELRRELDRKPAWAETLTQDIETLLVWVGNNREKVDQLVQGQANLLPEFKQEMELKLRQYLGYMSEMLDDREFTAAPGIISINAKDRSKWDPRSYFTNTYVLTPFCEGVQKIHPCENGRVEFTKDREWWEKTAPWIARGTRVLSVGLQLAFAGMPLAMGDQVFDVIKNDVKFMGELAKHMSLSAGDSGKGSGGGAAGVLENGLGKDLRGDDGEKRVTRMALAEFLKAVAPAEYAAKQWGSLRRVRVSDDSHRWLCDKCAKEARS